jgi:RNA polymerase sigma-70 factor (ECF subfamily)
MDDPGQIEQLRRFEPAAWSHFLDTQEKRLFNICLRMTGSRDDAAELTQDTLLKAMQHLEEFRGESKLSTWITRVAMNQALSFLRKRKLRHTASLDATGPADIDGRSAWATQLENRRELSPQLCVEKQEQIERLQAAIGRLDADFRAVIVLRDIDQMDYAEIAGALDLPLGTVKSRLFRGRLALREMLTETPASGVESQGSPAKNV